MKESLRSLSQTKIVQTMQNNKKNRNSIHKIINKLILIRNIYLKNVYDTLYYIYGSFKLF